MTGVSETRVFPALSRCAGGIAVHLFTSGMDLPQVDSVALDAAVDKLASELRAFLQPKAHFALVGIANGGITLARELARRIGREVPVGVVNAAFHRDDITMRLLPADFAATDLDFEVDGATIVLVDDVFATGRTIRAGLNELFDYGRPEEVCLAVLIDLGQKKLPLHPDFVGLNMDLEPGEWVKVHFGPDHAPTLELAKHAQA